MHCFSLNFSRRRIISPERTRPMLKKIIRFLYSMKFAILLLILLAAACVLGSVIPQKQSFMWYFTEYGSRTGALIIGLNLDDVFHAAWFLVLTVLLCCDLLACNLLHLPGLLARTRALGRAPRPTEQATAAVSGVADPAAVFARLRMPKPKSAELDGKTVRWAAKNHAGLWGAWATHLGALLLIIGFTMGQTTLVEHAVMGVPGKTYPVADTGLRLTIDDFNIAYTAAGNPEQFTAKLTMHGPEGDRQGEASVNHPAKLYGYQIYQNSVGTAAKAEIRLDGETVAEEVLCPGEVLRIPDTPLTISFEAYQKRGFGADGAAPGYTFTLENANSGERYRGLQAEGEPAIFEYGVSAMTEQTPTQQIRSYEVRFSQPRTATLLRLKQQRFTWLALLGGLITLAGLVLSFYLQPKRVWAVEDGDGWTVSGVCRKGGALFREQLRKAAGGGTEPKPDANKEEERYAES